MVDLRISPSPAADQAFRIGIGAATIGALALVALLAWSGVVRPLFAAVTFALLFPAYLLVAASVLSKWLGLDKDVSDLERVTRAEEPGDEWLGR